MAIKHVTTKIPGNKLFAVADWNANHTIENNTITPAQTTFSDQQLKTVSSPTFAGLTVNGQVGIGTATPAELLEIEGADDVFALVQSTGLDSDAGVKFQNDARTWLIYNWGGSNDKLNFFDGAVSVLTLLPGGDVGIGTTAPTHNLDVFSAGNAEINLTATNPKYIIENTEDISNLSLRMINDAAITWDVGVGGSAFVAIPDLRDNYYIYHGSVRFLIQNDTGNVGIGTTAPTSKLQVVGLPIYANNAAAVVGGLTAGAFYRTNADPDLVCVVH